MSFDNLRNLLETCPLLDKDTDAPSPDKGKEYSFMDLGQHMESINSPFQPSTDMIEYDFKRQDIAKFAKDVSDMFTIDCIDAISVSQAALIDPLEFTDIYLMGTNTMIYSPRGDTFRAGQTLFRGSTNFSKTSCVNTGAYIYQISGDNTIGSFQRLNLADNKMESIAMDGAGKYISVCYDQDRYIYLIGGNIRQGMDRIDRLDTTDNKISNLGKLPGNWESLYSHYCSDNKVIYYWGGPGQEQSSIYQLSPIDGISQRLLSFDTRWVNSGVISSCYDHKEYFYYISSIYLFKVSKNGNSEPVFLKPLPVAITRGTMVYAKVRGQFKLFLFSPKQTCIYDINSNDWTIKTNTLGDVNYSIAGHRILNKVIT
eukprot:gene9793-11440_t